MLITIVIITSRVISAFINLWYLEQSLVYNIKSWGFLSTRNNALWCVSELILICEQLSLRSVVH